MLREKLPIPVAALNVLHYPFQWEVLGLDHDATDKEIDTAYRTMSKWWHPDRLTRQGVDRRISNKIMAMLQRAHHSALNRLPSLDDRVVEIFGGEDDPVNQF